MGWRILTQFELGRRLGSKRSHRAKCFAIIVGLNLGWGKKKFIRHILKNKNVFFYSVSSKLEEILSDYSESFLESFSDILFLINLI